MKHCIILLACKLLLALTMWRVRCVFGVMYCIIKFCDITFHLIFWCTNHSVVYLAVQYFISVVCAHPGACECEQAGACKLHNEEPAPSTQTPIKSSRECGVVHLYTTYEIWREIWDANVAQCQPPVCLSSSVKFSVSDMSDIRLSISDVQPHFRTFHIRKYSWQGANQNSVMYN